MDYFAPNFLDEALVVLDRYGDGARVLAGGTLLGPRLRAGIGREQEGVPTALINIKRIAQLAKIDPVDGGLRIGALATADDMCAPLVRARAPLLALAAASIGAPQLRTVATLGGNLLSGHHAADVCVALLACDATVTVASARDGTSELSVEQMLAPGFAGIGRDAIVTSAFVPDSGARYAFEKMQTRRAFEMAIVSAAVAVSIRAGQIASARIALGGAAPTPIRANAAEAALAGSAPGPSAAGAAADAAAAIDAEPGDDRRASADYRRGLVRALVERALLRAFEDRRDDPR